MRRFIVSLSLISVVVLASCTTKIEYRGEEYPPTESVKVVTDAKELDRPFDVIGYLNAYAGDLVAKSGMQKKMIVMAKAKGADAIMFEDMGKTESAGGRDYAHSMGPMTDYQGNSDFARKEKRIRGILIKFR